MTQHKHHDHQGSCPTCDIGPFIRNNYFRGKFLDVLDFTTEQRYFIDKLRHHHQQLHGWGVVCGLKVKQHANPACRDGFICIEPGSAIDCCGHDLLLLEEECIDFTQLPAIKALIDKPDGKPHRIQICLRYRECPTEPVPVLYDDCGCDETRCAPNRILESLEFDAIVDAKDEPPHIYAPKLQWDFTLNIAHAYRAVLHDATDPPRLYVLTEDEPGIVFQLDAGNHSTITSHNLPEKGMALAISNDGTRVYVITDQGAGKPRQLYVLDADATQPGLTLVQASPLDIPGSTDSDAVLAVAPDGHLLALLTKTGDLLRWDTDVDSPPAPAAPATLVNLGVGLNALAIGSDGKFAYAAGASNKLQIFDFTANSKSDIDLLPGAKVTALAIAKSTGPDILAAADLNGNKVYLWPTDSASLLTVTVAHPPVGLIASPDAQWLYVLEREVGASYLQVINIQAGMLGQKTPPTAPFEIGHPAQSLALTESGARLYVPFPGNLQQAAVGGVAVVDITEQNCCEIPWRQLEGCPGCDTPNCVVLVTIEKFQVGGSIQDPPADPDDENKKIARIDNRTRRLLPTPQVLLELIECLKQQGPTGKGTQGPPGPQGLQGEKGDKGDTVVGPPGVGLEQDLVGIEALSWVHNGTFVLSLRTSPRQMWFPHVQLLHSDPAFGIIIGFTGEVDVTNILDDDYVFQILVENRNERDFAQGLGCKCPLRGTKGTIIPVDLDLDSNGRIKLSADGRIDHAKEIVSSKARGIAYLLDFPPGDSRQLRIGGEIVRGNIPKIWITLRGDFVMDTQGRAIDAEFVRAERPTGNRLGTNPALGIQGGTFESWFTIKSNDA